MLRVLVSMVALLLALGCMARDVDAPANILILGDSLSAGYGINRNASWPSLLQVRLREAGYRHSVINASISGETTSGGARRITTLLAEHRPAMVVIALGANDGLRGLDVMETRRNLRTIIDATLTAAAQAVLLKVRIPPNYGPRYTAAFEALFDELGAEPSTIYGPFMLERFASDPGAFQNDGLHPTAAVQPQIVDTLWPAISAAITEHPLEVRLN